MISAEALEAANEHLRQLQAANHQGRVDSGLPTADDWPVPQVRPAELSLTECGQQLLLRRRAEEARRQGPHASPTLKQALQDLKR